MTSSSESSVRTVVVVGCYASGKSTLITSLSGSLRVDAYNEVGGVLRSKAKCTSLESCSVFDELVMLREMERDETLLRTLDGGRSILLEQWHFGNLAYIKARHPEILPEYFSRLLRTNTIQRFLPIVLLLELDPYLISTRVVYERSEQLVQERIFFASWSRALREILSELRTPYIQIDASKSPIEVLENALAELSFFDSAG
jgi:thymidylate kinase